MSSSASNTKTKNGKSIPPATIIKIETLVAEPSLTEAISVQKTDSM
jgi:hypothetical protein